ncbi:hypothetical protein RYX36_018571 [Vicia faba]
MPPKLDPSQVVEVGAASSLSPRLEKTSRKKQQRLEGSPHDSQANRAESASEGCGGSICRDAGYQGVEGA